MHEQNVRTRHSGGFAGRTKHAHGGASGKVGAATDRAPGPSAARHRKRTVPAAPARKGVTRRRDLSILWFATAVVSLAVIGAWMLGRGVGRTTERPDPKALAAAAAESAVTRAERALAEGSDMERRYAAEFLGSARSGRSAVGPLMKAAAQDPSAEVRAEAVRALGRIADPRAVDTLTRAAAGDESAEVRSRAIRALGAMGAAGAADVIIDGLDSAATCDDATEALLDLGAASVLPLNDRVRSRGGMIDESVLDAEEMDMTITIRALIAAYKSPPREG